MNEHETLAARCAGFRFSHPIEVRFNDCDPLGHVNHATFLTYCEMARFHYWQTVVRDTGMREWTFIMAHATADYRRPVHWGETARVLLRTSKIGGKSFTMDYLVLAQTAEGELLAAEARTVQAMYDYTARRSVAVPPALVTTLEAFEGRALRP